ncbi:hypothetical protein CABS01_16609 [Colletotrichum abscissum]|uniref:uncharacterized protein n=1 Tax=Colletotrichum abscissum TaxID=1671311 RepID=UPI0027D5DD26|nr:uncharacterized protein CABS01_16609 [Colletotrichum abscissum]KAK1519289.1 hypothetical protein CABS01_16609 [Colletotrichum abscissum]
MIYSPPLSNLQPAKPCNGLPANALCRRERGGMVFIPSWSCCDIVYPLCSNVCLRSSI